MFEIILALSNYSEMVFECFTRITFVLKKILKQLKTAQQTFRLHELPFNNARDSILEF